MFKSKLISFAKTVLGVACVFGVLAGFGYYLMKNQQAAVVEKYGLSAEALAYAVACEDRMNWNDQEFTSGVDTLDGCGCIASRVQEQHPNDMVVGQAVIEDTIDWFVSDRDTARDWEVLASAADTDVATYNQLSNAGIKAMRSCNTVRSF